MKNLLAKIMKWKRCKSTQKHPRDDEFSVQLFDAIYDNNFELANILIDDGSVDVNIKNDCGDTPLIAVCQQRHYKLKKKLSSLFITYGRVVPSLRSQMTLGRQP
jgi:hypothetical protein